eukprot:6197639-Pleurochrysis_carterae.AAC.1
MGFHKTGHLQITGWTSTSFDFGQPKQLKVRIQQTATVAEYAAQPHISVQLLPLATLVSHPWSIYDLVLLEERWRPR